MSEEELINNIPIKKDDKGDLYFRANEIENLINEVKQEKDKEIARLNNIIIELEKWLNDLTILKTDKFGEARFYDMVKIQAVLNKLLELKGSGKE